MRCAPRPQTAPRLGMGVPFFRPAALLVAAVLAFLLTPVTAAQAYERVTAATATTLTLPSGLTTTLGVTGATTSSGGGTGTLGEVGYQASDFDPDVPSDTPAYAIATNVGGCPSSGLCTGRGTITLTFSQPLTNPRLHLAGLGSTDGDSANFHAILTVTSGQTLTDLSGTASGNNLTVTGGNTITTNDDNTATQCDTIDVAGATAAAGCGTVQVNGTAVTSVSFAVSAFVVDAGGPAPPTLSPGTEDVYKITVTADQDYGDAPASYDGNNAARHLVSAAHLGAGITVDNANVANSVNSPNAGASALDDADDATTPFADATVGVPTTYTKTIALSGLTKPGLLCGWVDFDRDGSFVTAERQCQTVIPGQTSATFSVTGTPASAGASYARFRLAYGTGSLSPTGPLSSGEVEDYPITFLAAGPEITLDKTASPTTVDSVDDVVTYTFVVSNTGGVELTNVTLNDLLPGLSAFDCPTVTLPTTLAVDESFTCTATRSTTQADLTAGGTITNTAAATGFGPATVIDTDDATVTVAQGPSIDLEKTGTPNPFTAAGQTITYTFAVTNTGNVPLNDVQVADPKAGLSAITCTPALGSTLQPGAGMTCTSTYTTTQADVNAGQTSNTAGAAGEAPDNSIAADEDSLTIPGPTRTPGISLTKTASPTTFTAAGQPITYTFGVLNTGNVTLTGVTVTDPLTGLSPIACAPAQPFTLAPGATVSCTATRSTTQADLDAGTRVNSATATGTSPTGVTPATVSDDDDATITGPVRTPAISLDKTAAPPTVSTVGEAINYTFVATNTGNVTLRNVVVTDPLPGLSAIICNQAAPVSLAPTGVLTCTATKQVTQADLDAGSVFNTATATGTSPTGVTPIAVSDSDDALVTASELSGLSLDKTADPVVVNAAGNEVTYTFLVTNFGDVTLSNVVVTDPLAGLSPITCDEAAPISLAPGADVECTATYTATQSDVDAGGIFNTATVRGEAPGGNLGDPDDDLRDVDSAAVNIPADPSVEIVKEADPSRIGGVGDQVSYTFTVTNTGNVSLNNVQIADPLPGLSPLICNPPLGAPLASGGVTTCTATYVATQADVEAGQINNVATVTGEAPGGNPEDPDDDVTDDDFATVTIGSGPSIDLVKTPSRATGEVGEVITYTFVATNTGSIQLADVTITDSMEGLSELTCDRAAPVTLAPGAVLTCTATYTLAQADLNRGEVVNVAVVIGDPPDDDTPPVSDKDAAIVELDARPEIAFTKTANQTSVRAGETITYTMVATNTGNVTLTEATITDPMSGLSDLACTPTVPSVLEPGEAMTCTASYLTTSADAQRGEVVNTATVTAQPSVGGSDLTSSGVVEVDVTRGPGLPNTGGPTAAWLGLAGLLTLLGGAALMAGRRRRS